MAAFLAVCGVLSSTAALGESFYERKPADIFLGQDKQLMVENISVSKAGTVEAKLSNGLIVLLKENHTVPIAMAQVTVKTGSIYEGDYLGTGISHLFEHLMAGGTTTTRTEEETKEILRSMGNMTNAYTSRDQTSYYIKTAKDDVPTAINLLADWMMNTDITEEEFNREMQVVQRESERQFTSPDRILMQLTGETMFHQHPARYPVIGFDSIRAKLTIDDVRRYRALKYVPNNMVFVVVGDFKWEDVLEQVRSAFEGFQRGPVATVSLPEEPEQVSKRVARKQVANLNTTLLSMSYRTIPLTDPDLYPLDVLSAILGQGESSRLVRKIKYELNLAPGITAWSYTPGYDAGVFTVYASVPDPANVQKVIDAVRQEIERCKTELVNNAELERVKNQVLANHLYSSESIESQARSLSVNYLSTGDPDFDNRYVEGIQNVTAEEVQRVANKYLAEANQTLTMVEPKHEETATLKTEQVEQASAVKKVTLENGLTVLLKRKPGVPVVSFQFYALAGLRVENPQNNGISNFTAQLWDEATESRTREQLAQEIDFLGAGLSTGSGNNTIFLNAQCLSKNFDQMLEIVSDVAVHPAFPADECENIRVRLLNAVKQKNDNIRTQAQRLLQKTFYGEGSPYALDSLGTEESLKSLTPDDLKHYYETYVTGPNAVLAVYGDIDLDKAEAAIRKAFGELSAKPAPEIEPAPAVKLDDDREAVVYRDRKDAAAVYFAYPTMEYGNVEDRYAMQMLDVVLSGGSVPGGWLHDALRGAGLVYEVHAFNYLGLDPRHFQIMAITNAAAVEQVQKIILEKVAKLKAGEITEEEFKQAKSICLTEELMGKQTNAVQAQSAALDELYGMGYDFDKNFAEKIKNITIADVVRVANKYLDNYTCAVVTHKLDTPADAADQQ